MNGLEGNGIRLVPAAISNAAVLLEVMQPEHAQNLAFFRSPMGLARQQAWLKRMVESRTDFLWVIESIEDNRIIGTCGLHEYDEENHNARLGLLIFDPADRHRGFGSTAIDLLLREAFHSFNLHKVYARVLESNTDGHYYFHKLGFTREGTMRQEYFLDGAYHDMVLLSILAPEWEQMQTSQPAPTGV